MHFLPEQNFDCGQCTKCCRGWRIGVDSETQAKLASHGQAQANLEQRDQRFYARKTPDGACVFLSSESLCSLHSQWGADHKPRGCRQFPFRLCRTPDGIYAGISFYCSSVQANQGRPLSAHLPELEELAAHLPLIGEQPLCVHGRTHIDWAGYRQLDDFLQRELDRDPIGQGLFRALWALCQITRGRKKLADYLERSESALQPPEEPFILMEHHFFCTLVARWEAPDDRRETFRKALQSHQCVTFQRFGGWRGRLPQLQAPLPPPGLRLLRRYLKALVFRKFVATRRPLLNNLAVLCLVPALFSFWSALSQAGRGASNPQEMDFFRALDELENKLITHPHDLDSLYQQVGEGFLDQLDFV